MAGDSPDQLEYVIDEAGSVVAAESSVIVSQEVDEGIPASAVIVHYVVSTHVHVKLNPLYISRKVQHIYRKVTNIDIREEFGSGNPT